MKQRLAQTECAKAESGGRESKIKGKDNG